jgi:flagellar M-ring protein FliF
MDPLLKQLRELPARVTALPPWLRYLVLGGLAAVVLAVAVVHFVRDGGSYQYAFTNLSPEDAAEAAAALKAAALPFRSEAGGSALAVPADKVHEVRLMLAAAGLPRGGGVGFEIFDRGDLGVSEFTQRVNLRRATEGELARTISRLSSVRSARVHITMPEKGLYRNEDRKAAAAVVLNLQPGRAVEERELLGVRHLVSAAVPGLSPESVTVVDGRGTVLAGDRGAEGKLASEQRQMEQSLERRILDILEPVVGRGAVVAKVTATLDSREVESTAEAFDPDSAVVRSERKVIEQTNSEAGSSPIGLAGAAANQPLAPTAGGNAGSNRGQTSRDDQLKNFEVNRTTTRTLTRVARLSRLSAAVLVSGVEGKPRDDAELKRLGDLARHAVGFDTERGDRFDISSAPFFAEPEVKVKEPPFWSRPGFVRDVAIAVVGLAVLVAVLRVGKGGRRRFDAKELALLKPGAKVGELDAALRAGQGGPPAPEPAPVPKAVATQNRARELASADPTRAAHLLRAWIANDGDMAKEERG